jgi:hypothetical protein
MGVRAGGSAAHFAAVAFLARLSSGGRDDDGTYDCLDL